GRAFAACACRPNRYREATQTARRSCLRSSSSMPGPNPSPNAMSLAFVEELYADFLRDPASVPEDWRRYFESSVNANGFSGQLGPSFAPSSLFNPASAAAAPAPAQATNGYVPRGNGAATGALSVSQNPAAAGAASSDARRFDNEGMKHAPLGSMRPLEM